MGQVKMGRAARLDPLTILNGEGKTTPGFRSKNLPLISFVLASLNNPKNSCQVFDIINFLFEVGLRVVNGPGRAGQAHFYLAHGHNGLNIMDY